MDHCQQPAPERAQGSLNMRMCPSSALNVEEIWENGVAFQCDNSNFYALNLNFYCGTVWLFGVSGGLLAPEEQPSDWIIVFFQLSACSRRLLDQLQTHGSVITGDAHCVGANRGMLFHMPPETGCRGTAAKQDMLQSNDSNSVAFCVSGFFRRMYQNRFGFFFFTFFFSETRLVFIIKKFSV